MVYGLVAIGIVLVFRASGVINFAQGQFGAFGASLMAVLYVNEGMPFWLTVPLAILIGRAARRASPSCSWCGGCSTNRGCCCSSRPSASRR